MSCRCWSCFRRELYAIQQGIRYFMDEIRGRHLVVWSDHKPIIRAFRNPQAMPYDPIAYNQLVEISMWTSDVRYLQAKSNCFADMLSRPGNVPLGSAYALPSPDEDALVDIAAVTRQQAKSAGTAHGTVSNGTAHQNRGRQLHETDSNHGRQEPVKDGTSRADHRRTPLATATDDPTNRTLDSAMSKALDSAERAGAPLVDAAALQIVDHGQLAKDQALCPDVAQHRKGNHAKSLNMTDFQFSPGVWIYCDVSDGKKARPLVPKPHRTLLIQLFHDISHPGSKETLRKVGARYYWPTMRKDVSEYVATCIPCNRCKPHRVIRPPLDTRPTVMPRFHDVQIDIIGLMPESEGMRYCLTVLDRTLPYFDAIPMAQATTTACAQAFIRQWVSHFGLPVRAGRTMVSNLSANCGRNSIRNWAQSWLTRPFIRPKVWAGWSANTGI